jgi:hypothetical protein
MYGGAPLTLGTALRAWRVSERQGESWAAFVPMVLASMDLLLLLPLPAALVSACFR